MKNSTPGTKTNYTLTRKNYQKFADLISLRIKKLL